MTVRPGYPYLNCAKALNVPYGLVLSYVDWLVALKNRGGVRPPPNYWQTQARLILSTEDQIKIEAAQIMKHKLRLET